MPGAARNDIHIAMEMHNTSMVQKISWHERGNRFVIELVLEWCNVLSGENRVIPRWYSTMPIKIYTLRHQGKIVNAMKQ